MPPFPTTAHRMQLESGFLEAANSWELSEPFRRLRVELMAVGARQGGEPWGRLSCGPGLSQGCSGMPPATGLTPPSEAWRAGGEAWLYPQSPQELEYRVLYVPQETNPRHVRVGGPTAGTMGGLSEAPQLLLSATSGQQPQVSGRRVHPSPSP